MFGGYILGIANDSIGEREGFVQLNRKKLGLVFPIAWIAVMAAGTTLMFTGITHESLWYDESYTAAIVNHSLFDIIKITGGDSHPPLYYLTLRIFVQIFGHSVFSLRTFSVLGVAALAAWGIGPVRRALGNRMAFLYTLITFALPITLSMAQETRMYTWAAFWVTGSALYGYLAYKEGRLRDWILFGVCSLCAAYTHYYALLAVAMICLMLFIAMLVEKKKLAPFLWTAGAMVAGYVPWLAELAGQVSRVTNSYWIPPVTGQVIHNVLVYPFSNKFSYPWSQTFVQIAFYAAAVLILFGIVHKIIRRDESVKLPILAVGAYILTLGAGILASVIIRPVLVERYMVTVLGLFILGIAYGIGSLGKKIWLPAIGCAVVIALAVPQTDYTISNRFSGPMTEAVQYLDPVIQPGDVFLHTDEHTFGTFCYYFPDNMNYYYERPGYGGYSNYDAFKPDGAVIQSLDDIPKGHTILAGAALRRPGHNLSAAVAREGAIEDTRLSCILQDRYVLVRFPVSIR